MPNSFEPPKVNTGAEDTRSPYERIRSNDGDRRPTFPGGLFALAVFLIALLINLADGLYVVSLAREKLKEIEKIDPKVAGSLTNLFAMIAFLSLFGIVANVGLLGRARIGVTLGILFVSANLMGTGFAWFTINGLAPAEETAVVTEIMTYVAAFQLVFSVVYIAALHRYLKAMPKKPQRLKKQPQIGAPHERTFVTRGEFRARGGEIATVS